MTEKQQQLLFDKGITNVPSDALCSDNALAESVGMVYDNGEHRVIQKPAEFMSGLGTKTVLYVHKYNNQERYIVKDGNNIKWGTRNTSTGVFYLGSNTALLTASGNVNVTSIGKTLIITDNNGIHYFLWEMGGTYNDIGEIPDPSFYAELYGGTEQLGDDVDPEATIQNGFELPQEAEYRLKNNQVYYSNTGNGILAILDDKVIIADSDADQNPSGDINSKQVDFNNAVVGLYAKNKKAVAAKKGFCLPFFIRYAIKMYDGSYTRVSQPILLMPSVTSNSYAKYYNRIERLVLFTAFSKLYINVGNELKDYTDIIKSIDIFISSGVEIYDTNADQAIVNLNDLPNNQTYTDYILYDGVYATETYEGVPQLSSNYTKVNPAYDRVQDNRPILWKRSNYGIDVLKKKEQKDINKDIERVSVFYKICSVGVNGHIGNIADLLDSNVLENLTTQEQLPQDDYFSRSKLYPQYMYSYNSRLNLANVTRGFFEGYGFFTPIVLEYDQQQPINPFSGNGKAKYTFQVTIKSENGDVTVEHQENGSDGTGTLETQGLYFYYPDSRASHVKIWLEYDPNVGKKLILDTDLKEHTGLNGAYYFKGMPTAKYAPTNLGGQYNQEPVPSPEILPNYIITSEVNNPWVFLAEGYYKVGTGKILGMSSITQALSEGQFGQYPLLVFSESGIWALSVVSTGYYSSIHPMSREVSNDPACLIQTDGAVFFTSDKGLMVVVGNQVKCVSEQMAGKNISLSVGGTSQIVDMGNFHDYLKDCFIAYDYRDSLLWIFNNSRASNTEYCYVYSIKTGTFSKYMFGTTATPISISNVVNNYPDYLLQSGDKLYSLTNRADINLDGTTSNNIFTPNTYAPRIITRPMKFENALALKSIMDMQHIKDFSSSGTLTLKIFASNNIKDWVELDSLRGTPWKYYRFRFDFANLIATDRFAGTMIVTQERRTDKLR